MKYVLKLSSNIFAFVLAIDIVKHILLIYYSHTYSIHICSVDIIEYIDVWYYIDIEIIKNVIKGI